jgi:mannose-6-phosphate isomerase-like protein (cupin superfamily)
MGNLFFTKLNFLLNDTRSRYFLIDRESRSSKPNNKWSKKEILGHLIDSARINLNRFTDILISNEKHIAKPYQQDQLVLVNDYQNTPEYDLLSLWQLLNHQIITVLKGAKISDWEKVIIVGNEERTLSWLAHDYLEHMEHHIRQIFKSENLLSPPLLVSLNDALQKLSKKKDKEFVGLAHFADLEIEYYQPKDNDKQNPHLKDEVYFIASGTSEFSVNQHKVTVSKGDVLFVKAGDEHKFVNFSEDFAIWVIFYGLSNYAK